MNEKQETIKLPVLGSLISIIDVLFHLQNKVGMVVGGSYMLALNGLTAHTPEDVDIIIYNPTEAVKGYLQVLAPLCISHTDSYEPFNDVEQIKFKNVKTNTILNILLRKLPAEEVPTNHKLFVNVEGIMLPTDGIVEAFKGWRRYAIVSDESIQFRKKDVDHGKEILSLLPPIDAQWIVR